MKALAFNKSFLIPSSRFEFTSHKFNYLLRIKHF